MMVVFSLSAINLFGAAKVSQYGCFQLAAGLFRNNGCAGQDSNILKHGFSAIAKTGGFYSQDIQHAAQFIEDQGSQGFAIDIFSDDNSSRLPIWTNFSSRGTISAAAEIFLS